MDVSIGFWATLCSFVKNRAARVEAIKEAKAAKEEVRRNGWIWVLPFSKHTQLLKIIEHGHKNGEFSVFLPESKPHLLKG